MCMGCNYMSNTLGLSVQKQLKRPIHDIMIYFYAVKYKDTI